METIWVLLADEGRVRILAMRRAGRDLEEVDELTDAAAHADDADLRRDAYGRRSGADPGMGASSMSSAGEEALDHEADLFARRVAAYLGEALQRRSFERLRFAAAPRFLGRLRKHLDDAVCAVVVDDIDKDLLQLDRRTLTQRLFPPDRDDRGAA